MSAVLIRNAANVVTDLGNPEVLKQTDILIEDDLISAVGTEAPEKSKKYADLKVIDGSKFTVLPGMVCSHHHYYSGLSRGVMAEIGPTPDFISTLKELWWRIDRSLDEESTYYSSLICSMDAVRSGTTSVIDHHASPNYIEGSLDAIRRGFQETGLRGMTCYEVSDRNGGMAEVERGVEENRRFAEKIDEEKRSGSWDSMFEAAIGGHAPFTIPDEGLRLIADALSATGRGIHIHLAEDLYDLSVSHHRYGKDLIARLNDFGLVNDTSLLVHGIYLSDEDIEILNRADGFLIHNARSNMNNHVGYNTSLPKIRNLALGTDGIGADMFEELKFAFFKNRDAGSPFWPGDYLSALSNGNRILERYFDGFSFGKIEPGCKADIVLADYRSPTPFVGENIAGHIAFAMGSGVVDTVLINGKVVLEGREFPFDEERLYREASVQAEAVWKRMNRIH